MTEPRRAMTADDLQLTLAQAAHHALSRNRDCPCGQAGRLDCEDVADALLPTVDAIARERAAVELEAAAQRLRSLVAEEAS